MQLFFGSMDPIVTYKERNAEDLSNYIGYQHPMWIGSCNGYGPIILPDASVGAVLVRRHRVAPKSE
jgi:hypothetical protein